MMQQYKEIKKEYGDAILFFRLGDFYEMFFEDALTASRELEITLTGREGGEDGRVPMCGVPYHAADNYIARLVGKGYRVAVCDQLDPPSNRGLVRRAVVRLVTRGTVLEDQFLEPGENNFLAALLPAGGGWGLACADVSTGEMTIGELPRDGNLGYADELARLKPAEVLLPAEGADQLAAEIAGQFDALVTRLPLSAFNAERGPMLPLLRDREDLAAVPLGTRAGGALLTYLGNTLKKEYARWRLTVRGREEILLLDRASRRNLEITRSLRDGGREGTLLAVLDDTVTAMGGRLIRAWLEEPSTVVATINERLDAVEELKEASGWRRDLAVVLRQVRDLERLAARAALGQATPRDLAGLRASLRALPQLLVLLAPARSALVRKLVDEIDPLPDLLERLAALVDEPPAGVREGGLFRDGCHPEIDRLRQAAREGRGWLAGLEAGERERTGIRSLKVGYNRVFGYYLEVTKSNLDLVPDDYQRRQTLAGAERFVTPRLKEYEDMILGAQDRLAELEEEMFTALRTAAGARSEELCRTGRAVAVLDVLASLASAAVRYKYCRPSLDGGGRLHIVAGRHPVVERVLPPGRFVPNDTAMDGQRPFVLLTGPNMAGKSTYLRQVALITLMAQAGSFVPAEYADIGIVDRIFTRIGASDDLASGRSTFMVEMDECRAIVRGATEHSLLILDEVGRGTSTYDGISIAWALAEHIYGRIGARTLFSTHYHELTELAGASGPVNYTMAVQEQGEEVVFLHRVVPGKADRSYGIFVAGLAGLPKDIITRARELLARLESRTPGVQAAPAARPPGEEKLLRSLRELDLPNLTPLAALNRLNQLKELLESAD
ncbi:MAG: DNA mismatch repair protein MutS [Peptococcaceae bacterium]|jgi:DNA mismatch repair protein MutS|nr:DNA mismatch repair protein MutS [Peptococcaceae bacterium]